MERLENADSGRRRVNAVVSPVSCKRQHHRARSLFHQDYNKTQLIEFVVSTWAPGEIRMPEVKLKVALRQNLEYATWDPILL